MSILLKFQLTTKIKKPKIRLTANSVRYSIYTDYSQASCHHYALWALRAGGQADPWDLHARYTPWSGNYFIIARLGGGQASSGCSFASFWLNINSVYFRLTSGKTEPPDISSVSTLKNQILMCLHKKQKIRCLFWNRFGLRFLCPPLSNMKQVF